MPTWIRCPHCDVALPVRKEDQRAEVRCDACGNRLGSIEDRSIHVERPLDIQAQATLEGHTRDVWSLAFSPDGRTLASGSIDHTIRLWDPETGEVRSLLQGHGESVLAVTFSPDGRTLASGSRDGTVRLWDVASRTHRNSLTGYTDSSLAFSPDGSILVTGGVDDTVRSWEVESGRELPALHVLRNSVRAVAFSPDGSLLALGHSLGSGFTVQLWEAASLSARFAFEGLENVTSVAFSPDGSTLAAADLAGRVRLWDVASGRERTTLTPLGRNQYFQPSAVLSLAFSPVEPLLAMGLHLQSGANVQLWDAATGEAQAAFPGHRHSVRSVAFSPDGRTLATGGSDMLIKLWRLPAPHQAM